MNTPHKSCARRTRRSSTAGFNLIEIMVTMVIIAVGLLGLISALTTGIRVDRETREYVLSMNIARSVLEDMKNMPLDGVLGNYSVGGTPGPNAAGTVTTGLQATTAEPIIQVFFPVNNATGFLDERVAERDSLGVLRAHSAIKLLPGSDPLYDWSFTMPNGGRDLNGDGDRLDVNVPASGAGKYIILPVRILITYRAINQQGNVGIKTVDLVNQLNP
jgi:prepilin-type N-terminal cleavage/methylation domain-containing protein